MNRDERIVVDVAVDAEEARVVPTRRRFTPPEAVVGGDVTEATTATAATADDEVIIERIAIVEEETPQPTQTQLMTDQPQLGSISRRMAAVSDDKSRINEDC